MRSIFALILLLTFSCKRSDPPYFQEPNSGKIELKASEMKTDETGLSFTKVILKTIYGNIAIKFYPKQAPNTVTRVLSLMQSGFYNGLKFHRVISNFVIQTGDPTATGTGGSGVNIKAEFNSIPHVKGTVAMARAKDPDSADSQFYIALSTLPHLDKNYTVFAKVVQGEEILEKITQGDKILHATILKN
jgi:cyclophilin family peptidyl-prolyl cis-trans isomerase